MNIASALSIAVALQPDAIAVEDGAEQWTYGRLAGVAETAKALLEANGVAPGDVVTLIQVPSPSQIASLMAVTALGAVANPINFRLKPPEIAGLLAASGASVIVCDSRYEQLCLDLGLEVTVLRTESVRADVEVIELSYAEQPDNAPAVMLFTSGTTGVPKPVRFSHSTLMDYLYTSAPPPEIGSVECSVVCVPCYHVAGLTAVLTSLYSGRRIRTLGAFSSQEWMEAVSASGGTHSFLVPTMVKEIVDAPSFDKSKLASLEVLSYGAGPMPRSVITKALELFPPTTGFVNAYGLTEAGGVVSMLLPDDHREAFDGKTDEARARLSSVGRAVAGAEVRIAQPTPGEAVGQVEVRRDALEWIESGDLGYLDDEGYLFLVGRAVDRIVRGGENIDPIEIEEALRGCDEFIDAAVVGRPDERWGEVVVAFVVTENQAAVDVDRVQAQLRKQLSGYKVPAEFVVIESLPRNSLGKVLKPELRARLSETENNSEVKSDGTVR
jgi:acyl-CoA synthetase (AMP-forming)/AMP-acid ligase II